MLRHFLSRQRLIVLVIAVVACVSIGCGASPTTAPREIGEPEWYVPTEADFRLSYDKDAANKAAQKWEDYWSWAKQFYDGNLFSPAGWTKRADQLVAGVAAGQGRAQLRGGLNDLGRVIAAEWAKDNRVRKISTKDVEGYNARLKAAKARDDGSGEELRREAAAVLADAQSNLAR